MCEIRARLAENGLQLRNTFPTVEFMAFGPEPAPISWCWWPTNVWIIGVHYRYDLSSLSSFPDSSSEKGSWKGIRTLATPVPKPCSGCPTIPWKNFSNLSVPVPFNGLYLSLTMRFIGDQILGWLYLKSIRLKGTHQPEVPPKIHKPCRPMAFVCYWSQTKIGLEGSIFFSTKGLSSYNLKIGFLPGCPFHSSSSALLSSLKEPISSLQEAFCVEIMVFGDFMKPSIFSVGHRVSTPNPSTQRAICCRHGYSQGHLGKETSTNRNKNGFTETSPTQFWSCRVVQYDAFYFYNNKLHVAYRMSWGLKAKITGWLSTTHEMPTGAKKTTSLVATTLAFGNGNTTGSLGQASCSGKDEWKTRRSK